MEEQSAKSSNKPFSLGYPALEESLVGNKASSQTDKVAHCDLFEQLDGKQLNIFSLP